MWSRVTRLPVFYAAVSGSVPVVCVCDNQGTPDYVFQIPPVAVPKKQAAAMLGVSVDSFERHIQSDLKVIRKGRLRLYPVAELERWARDSAERTRP
jgi:hypothetical protein